MLDNLRTWTYPLDGLPGIILGRDWVLANASLYSLTASGGSSAYVGYAQAGGWGAPPANSGIPTAAIQFAHDLGDRSRVVPAHRPVVTTRYPWEDLNLRPSGYENAEVRARW
jgi:hypothetical protein